MKLDEFLPTWQFNEVHTVVVDAPPGRVFTAMKELTPAELSPLIFWMLDLRNLPAKLAGKHAPTAAQAGPFLDLLYMGGFIPLTEEPGREIIFGLVGQFWKLDGGEEPPIPSPEAFLAFDDPAFAKVKNDLAGQLMDYLKRTGDPRAELLAAHAAKLGLKPLATIRAYASAGIDPAIMGMGPVPASRRCLEKAGWKPADLDLMEINEAFAAQACAVNKEMGWDTSRINVNGGAIAMGHPIGASGCRVLVSLLHEMGRRDAKKGLASLCIGGGMGVALAVER